MPALSPMRPCSSPCLSVFTNPHLPSGEYVASIRQGRLVSLSPVLLTAQRVDPVASQSLVRALLFTTTITTPTPQPHPQGKRQSRFLSGKRCRSPRMQGRHGAADRAGYGERTHPSKKPGPHPSPGGPETQGPGAHCPPPGKVPAGWPGHLFADGGHTSISHVLLQEPGLGARSSHRLAGAGASRWGRGTSRRTPKEPGTRQPGQPEPHVVDLRGAPGVGVNINVTLAPWSLVSGQRMEVLLGGSETPQSSPMMNSP